MNAHPDETPPETAAAPEPPNGSPAGRLEPERALAIWRNMQAHAPIRLDVGMLWAAKPEGDLQAASMSPPRHGEGRWLATLLPPIPDLLLLGDGPFGGTSAAAWVGFARPAVSRFMLWSYRAATTGWGRPGLRSPTALDVEVFEAEGVFGFDLADAARWLEAGDLEKFERARWQRVDDLGVRTMCHRLSMVALGDMVSRPLRV